MVHNAADPLWAPEEEWRVVEGPGEFLQAGSVDLSRNGEIWGMGMSKGSVSPSQAVRLLFHRIAVDQAFPLELKVPNARTRSAMAEVDEMVKTRGARFASADEMFTELEEAGGR